MLQASKCCCCADLRTGGIIIGILNSLYALALIFDGPDPGPIVFGAIIGVGSGALLYGIFAKKTVFIIPMIVISIIELCIMALFVLGLLLGTLLFHGFLKSVIAQRGGKNKNEEIAESFMYTVAFLFLALNILLIWLTVHFIAVLCSLRKQMSEDTRPSVTYDGV